MQPSRDICRLIEILAALRCPGTGCPWDLEQTFETIVPYTIEEAYEIADAVARGDIIDLKEELGDLLLQVVFHARIAEESGLFDFGAVVETITEKMIRRHPHVFGQAKNLSYDEIKKLWSKIKAEEQAQKRPQAGSPEIGSHPAEAFPLRTAGLLEAVPLALPGLTRAVKLQAKASTVGFDWNDARLVINKIREETNEIELAVESGQGDAIFEELGDLLFTLANLARHLSADPESAIRHANVKFERRFHFIEQELARQDKRLGAATLEEMEALWHEAKRREKDAAATPA